MIKGIGIDMAEPARVAVNINKRRFQGIGIFKRKLHIAKKPISLNITQQVCSEEAFKAIGTG
jgi:hypothetical protein